MVALIYLFSGQSQLQRWLLLMNGALLWYCLWYAVFITLIAEMDFSLCQGYLFDLTAYFIIIAISFASVLYIRRRLLIISALVLIVWLLPTIESCAHMGLYVAIVEIIRGYIDPLYPLLIALPLLNCIGAYFLTPPLNCTSEKG